MNFAAFTDLHGSVKTLRKIVNMVGKKDVDVVVFTGDFVSLKKPITAELDNLEEILLELDSLDIPVFFVWGNRDLLLFKVLRKELEKKGHNFPLMKFEQILFNRLDIENLWVVRNSTKFSDEPELYITSDYTQINEKTIYITHYKSEVFSDAFLHLEGHVHYGQFKDNYFNLGFAYRDDLHGGKPLEGLIWFFEIEKDYEVSFHYELLGDLKEIVCPYHAGEGTFIVPKYWKKCPVCYSSEKSKFLKYYSTSH